MSVYVFRIGEQARRSFPKVDKTKIDKTKVDKTKVDKMGARTLVWGLTE